MVDNLQNESADVPPNDNGGAETAEGGLDHPHIGIASEGWSSPQGDISGQGISNLACNLGRIVLKRGGGETDIQYPINPPCVVGRFDPTIGPVDIDLGPIPEGSYVSRKHAEFVCDDGQWKLKDLGSSNGTFVVQGGDFQKVDEADLSDGQEIAFGNARFVFHVVPLADDAAQPSA